MRTLALIIRLDYRTKDVLGNREEIKLKTTQTHRFNEVRSNCYVLRKHESFTISKERNYKIQKRLHISTLSHITFGFQKKPWRLETNLKWPRVVPQYRISRISSTKTSTKI